MKILHTEASSGYGGQEIRIIKEAIGMRKRGHTLLFAVQKGGKLVSLLRHEGFVVYELDFRRQVLAWTFFRLLKLVIVEGVQLLNTHSPFDSWIGGLVARATGRKVVRTRHLSTPVRKGVNSLLLYNFLADHVVTTCQEVVGVLKSQARLPSERICSIPTGVDPTIFANVGKNRNALRASFGFSKSDIVVGTCCVHRVWKGVTDLLEAAKLLAKMPQVKFLIVGGGISEDYLLEYYRKLGLGERVHFTGFLDSPLDAIEAMDIFALLSWAHEGVSQAILQAAFLSKPLVATETGGLKEVCIEGKSGFAVPIKSPAEVALAITRLAENKELREKLGRGAHQWVQRHFLFEKMINQMQRVYENVCDR